MIKKIIHLTVIDTRVYTNTKVLDIIFKYLKSLYNEIIVIFESDLYVK